LGILLAQASAMVGFPEIAANFLIRFAGRRIKFSREIDEIWRYFHPWILALGFDQGAPNPAVL